MFTAGECGESRMMGRASYNMADCFPVSVFKIIFLHVKIVLPAI